MNIRKFEYFVYSFSQLERDSAKWEDIFKINISFFQISSVQLEDRNSCAVCSCIFAKYFIVLQKVCGAVCIRKVKFSRSMGLSEVAS